jgi:hypothetical protein
MNDDEFLNDRDCTPKGETPANPTRIVYGGGGGLARGPAIGGNGRPDEAEAPAVAMTAAEQDVMHRALRRSATKIEAEKAEPVAWTTDYEIQGLRDGFVQQLTGRSMRLEPSFPPYQVKAVKP